MLIAFVSPPSPLYDKFKRVAEAEFSHIGVEYLAYASFEEVPALLDGRQEKYDAVVFAGHVAMKYANMSLQRKTLWLRLPRAGSTILAALLNAVRMGWDITRLSFDSYNEALLREIYEELGYDLSADTFSTFKGNMADKSYSGDAFQFHKDNLRTQKAVGCITALYKVHLQLEALRLPSIFLVPTRSVIREQLNFVQQFRRAKEDAKGRISAILITIDFPSDHSVMRENDALFMQEKMKIAQQIYRYAGQLQATVLEVSLRDYLLFSTKETIELETEHYRSFGLLERMEQETLHHISIGIGHGETVAASKSNAVAAMLRAQKFERNSACVCLSGGRFLGPFFGDSPEKDETRLDGKLLKIAEAAGISVNTIYKLHCFLLNNSQQTFTSQELSEGLMISKRSTDRILQNLEQHGFVNVVGKRMMKESGRPTRVISFNSFNLKDAFDEN